MSSQETISCYSEHSEESLFFKPPRFFTPLRSVQNDMNFHSFLTATAPEMAGQAHPTLVIPGW
jgi:hypothetical protein